MLKIGSAIGAVHHDSTVMDDGDLQAGDLALPHFGTHQSGYGGGYAGGRFRRTRQGHGSDDTKEEGEEPGSSHAAVRLCNGGKVSGVHAILPDSMRKVGYEDVLHVISSLGWKIAPCTVDSDSRDRRDSQQKEKVPVWRLLDQTAAVLRDR